MSRSRKHQDASESSPAEWHLFAWTDFARQFSALFREVERLRETDPVGYRNHPRSRLLAAVLRLVRDVIPSNPASESFRQGNTLGPTHRHWFRAKFFDRFRLFFRFSSERRIIVYVWMSDEGTLRKSSARSDPYHVFRQMLERGSPPEDFEALLAESQRLGPPDGS